MLIYSFAMHDVNLLLLLVELNKYEFHTTVLNSYLFRLISYRNRCPKPSFLFLS